jgi:two-component system nitrate/nitrite response regulator NarL
MTQQLFVTPAGVLEDRWRKAFPDAQLSPSLEAITERVVAPAIIWLDFSAINLPVRNDWLRLALTTRLPVVVITDKPSNDEAMAVVQAGAMGYCHCMAIPSQLQEIAVAVEHGGLWVGQELLQKLLLASVAVASPANRDQAAHALAALTDRERMVAAEVAKGASNKEIARVLDITERTVKAHLSVIFEKLAVRDRVQLALLLNNVPRR